MAVIDAKGLLLGRMCSEVAERLLLGETIDIVNCEEAVISGDKYRIIRDFKRKREMGIPSKGPHYPKESFKIVKRTVRGMLPYKREKGRKAFDRLKCYNTLPEAFRSKPTETMEKANVDKLPNTKFVKVKHISMIIGGKVE